jgi:hypothetical protein
MKVLVVLCLFGILTSQGSVNSYSEDEIRNLQAAKARTTSKSIYYSVPFTYNNITGTGNKLRDDAYRVICKSLNCESGCCAGDTNSMRCGVTEDCLKWVNWVKSWTIAIIVLVVAFGSFSIVFSVIRGCNRNNGFCESVILALIVWLGIIFFPITLVVLLVRCISRSGGRQPKTYR